MYDVIVIGFGPAGMSAAVNASRRGKKVACLYLPLAENPLFSAEKIDNYLGVPNVSGGELMRRFAGHTTREDMDAICEQALSAVRIGSKWMVSAGDKVFESRTVVYAGGIVRGSLFPGEEEFLGKGVSYCTTCDGMLYKGKKVVVIETYDTTGKDASFLKHVGCDVRRFIQPKKVEIKGDERVNAVVVNGEEVETDGVFIIRQSFPATSLFPDVETDGKFIKVDRQMRTNLPGLYAAGDCTGTPFQIAKAVGEGLVAGLSAAAECDD